MLGRLIQTAASYGRGNNTLESATEESHTRNLLYGQTLHTYSLGNSPPTSPYATPHFRPGSFDDRGGLELEEKDIRVLVAQDAGADEKPTLLFDSRPASPVGHVRHTSMTGPRATLPTDWKSPAQNAASVPPEHPFKNRSSTTTGGAAPWGRQLRDSSNREDTFLDCMFGVTSSTKTAATTKIHILPGKLKTAPKLESRGKTGTDAGDQYRRAPLHRARTSSTIVKPQHHPTSPGSDIETQAQDSILITRLFSIALSETVAPTLRSTDDLVSPPANNAANESAALSSHTSQSQTSKKPKLVERKVPAFAVGLIINLPRSPDSHLNPIQSRPTSRSMHAQAASSASSSYGSDMQGSWTFLNAIPESLASADVHVEETDRRIETIISNEDVILRAMAMLETESARIIFQQLQKILDHMVGPGPKAPKEKAMQRTNQRIVSISDTTPIAQASSLRATSHQITRRILYALRIPRVVVGSGFGAGHWPDEARAAYRVCGRRQQNFFFFTLLTAFLGHHTQWLQRLAPDWYRKQHRSVARQHSESHALYQRTVIVSDQRAIARRLIFLLASFLPGVQGFDGLQKPGEDMNPSHLSMSSPSSHIIRNESLRRTANRRMRENRLQPGVNDRSMLSTSADSVDSMLASERPLRFLARKDSDALSIRGTSLLSALDGENNRKASAATTSAFTSHPTTPVAVFSTQRGSDPDSYFPPFVDNNESVATAGLNSILRRSSSSLSQSNASSRWGSLMSGLSDMLASRQNTSVDSSSTTAYSSATGSTGRRSTELKAKPIKGSALQEMVDQLEEQHLTSAKSPKARFADGPASLEGFSSPIKHIASAPRLRVDDKDGVVDVDLDLPGFTRFDTDDLFKSPSKSTSRSAGTSVREAAESIRSLRSLPASSPSAQSYGEWNVAGYLKRHHEDFCLHAIRPYSELEEDVKRSMLAEPLPPTTHDSLPLRAEDPWTSVCTTVIADMRTFSIRKLTLKRKLGVVEEPANLYGSAHSPNPNQSKKVASSDLQHTFVDEEIKDFDTALADAIEKVLDLGDAIQSPTLQSPRIGHTRTSSSATVKSTPPNSSTHGLSGFAPVAREYVRQDCRQVVLGALEEVVKDVCSDLSKLERGRDIHGGRSFDASAIKEEMKQENVLREGVKCWLLNLEQPRVF